MRKITKGQLEEIINKHQIWLNDKEGGEKANLANAILGDISFRGLDLSGADFWGAYLGGADFTNANLQSADLRRANMREVTFMGSDLRGATLNPEHIYGSALEGANLDGAKGVASRAEAVSTLDKVREAVLADETKLNMASWHCGTSHCIAGWVQVVEGLPLNDHAALDGIRFAWPAAHMFHATDDEALQFLKDREYANND